MRSLLLCFLFAFALTGHAQNPYCGMTSESNAPFATTYNVTYASPTNAFGFDLPMGMDIYRPTNTTEKRPLILFIHGGAFITGSRTEMADACELAAAHGFVSATMSYRLGWFGVDFFNICSNDFNQFTLAALRATQDARSALRFLYDNADLYGIDTNYTIVAGYSAGAITALNTVYVDQDEASAVFPDQIAELGEFPTIGGIRGVCSFAGALVEPSWIDNNTNIAVMSVHGTCDEVVMYGTGPVFECTNFPDNYGDAVIQQRADSLGMNRAFYTACGGGHGLNEATIAEGFDSLMTFANRVVLCNLNNDAEWAKQIQTQCENSPIVAPQCLIFTESESEQHAIVRAYPNPCTEKLLLSAPMGTEVKLVSPDGRTAARITMVENTSTWVLPNLPTACYYAHFLLPNGSTQVQMIQVGEK